MEDLCSSLSDMLTGHSAVGRASNSHAVALPWQHRLGVGINCRIKPQPMKRHHSRASVNQQGVILTLSVSGYLLHCVSEIFSPFSVIIDETFYGVITFNHVQRGLSLMQHFSISAVVQLISYRRRNLLGMRALCFSSPSASVSAAETLSQAKVLPKQHHIKMRWETLPKVVSWVFGFFCIYLALCDCFHKDEALSTNTSNTCHFLSHTAP